MYERVAVAIDWSEPSERALEAAKGLARLSGGEVRLLHVHEVERLPPHGPGPLASAFGAAASPSQNEAAERLAQAAKQISDAGIKTSSEMRISLPGRVAAEIVEEATAWGADAIVIGSRGLTNLAGIILGSTTHKLLHLASVPVVVVR
jgi:nucleotide-binding universal stress UspA family protein